VVQVAHVGSNHVINVLVSNFSDPFHLFNKAGIVD